MRNALTINERIYQWPARPTVVICVDGCEFDYITQAVAAGVAPFLQELLQQGACFRANSALPSYTNPNNVSIITGVPPAVHGYSGNFFHDPATGEEVMMNTPKYLRCDTILAAFSRAGAKVVAITAKDKLRTILGHDLRGGICFSSEKADQATLAENGVEDVLRLVGLPLPEVYSAELSEFVFAAGVKLLKLHRPELMYLSTTDYVQHKWAPGTDAANRFYQMIDRYVAQLDALGAVVVVTADHGMNAKTRPDGNPNVIYLQEQLDGWYGKDRVHVILPIVDPYVVHHGSLGSYAVAYVGKGIDCAEVIERLAKLPEMEIVLERDEACRRFELPRDRLGDIVMFSRRHSVLATSKERHDLSVLDVPLRSHGGITEQEIPLLLNKKVFGVPRQPKPRNFDAFYIALNHIAH